MWQEVGKGMPLRPSPSGNGAGRVCGRFQVPNGDKNLPIKKKKKKKRSWEGDVEGSKFNSQQTKNVTYSKEKQNPNFFGR